MSSNIHFFTNKVTYKIDRKSKTGNWLKEVILSHNMIPGEINVVLTSDKELLDINLKYLNTDTYTDIISFPLSEEDGIISGDIYISIERIRENARKFKISTDDELRRIFVHGILHLMGFDDIETNDKRRMTRLENKYLKMFS